MDEVDPETATVMAPLGFFFLAFLAQLVETTGFKPVQWKFKSSGRQIKKQARKLA
jgi:hypothetical protein